jgi:hypothetical protein
MELGWPATNGNFESMKKVSLITDGSCLGNPGPGGWACILRLGGVKKEFFGFDPHTTNNRMELMAPIQGLLALKEPCEVEITTVWLPKTPSELKMQWFRAFVRSWWYHNELSFCCPFRFAHLQF